MSAAGAPRLDKATHTVIVRPRCGEASLIAGHSDPSDTARAASKRLRQKLGSTRRGNAHDPERAQQEARSRARRELRRWCVQNGATRLGTLTYREANWDYDQVWRDIEALRRELREAGYEHAFAAVPEGHPGPHENGVQVADSHGWHVHLALAKYVPKAVLEDCWKRATANAGFVEVRKIRAKHAGNGPAGARAHARTCAGYLAEYVTKSDDDPGMADAGGHAERDAGAAFRAAPVRPFNRKRYSLTRGHRVEVVRFVSLGRGFGIRDASRLCGYPITPVWQSPEDWRGPPIMLLEG